MEIIGIIILMMIISSIMNLFTNSKKTNERSKPGTGPRPQETQQSERTETSTRESQESPFGDLGKQLEEMFGGGSEEQQERPTSRQPRADSTLSQPEQQETSSPDSTVVSKEMQEFEKRREEARNRKKQAEQELQAKTKELQAKQKRIATRVDEGELVSFKNISRKDIVQGMVWSEILTEPRGTKPHRTNPRTPKRYMS
ncbi:hypothetical protein ACE1TF_17960 [Geomicrobium sp. JSM 1781026]|uniref:hypothetical protein n=1 Tax=Geomicrobium sp. JSM 1781026 TaxID=3344580 RepID=UPI0035C1E35C